MNSKVHHKQGHITIALAVFNGESTIEKAVRSLLSQSYGHFDLYVVDDASTDNTFEILQTLLPDDRRLHVVRLATNHGTYSAKNLILRDFCRSEFFAHQDADDISWQHRLRAQVAFLAGHPRIAACGTGIDEFYLSDCEGPSTQSDCAPVFNPEDGYYHRDNYYDSRIPKGACFQYAIDNLGHIKIAMNGSILFRSKILKQLGGFDGRTRLAGDTEMLWRILTCHPLGNLQEILYSRLFHSRSMTKSKAYGIHSELRATYVKKTKEWLMKLQPLYASDKTGALLKEITRDMYVADSSYQLYDGG